VVEQKGIDVVVTLVGRCHHGFQAEYRGLSRFGECF
jgi:hypothetical protein